MTKLYEVHLIDDKYIITGLDGELLPQNEARTIIDDLESAYPQDGQLYFLTGYRYGFGELIKCGVTSQSIPKRMSQIKHADNIKDLKLWVASGYLDWEVVYNLEQALHGILQRHKAFGEWYYDTHRTRYLIKSIMRAFAQRILDSLDEIETEPLAETILKIIESQDEK